MRKSLLTIAIVCCFLLNTPAQHSNDGQSKDATQVAPQAYKLEFENEWVRVMHVHYAPHEKIAEHYHTERPAAYVYLNDGGPVIFKHIDLPYGAITRPATKAGSFRLYRSVKEVHAVENTSDLASDFLRVEFKTDPVNENSLRGKYFREQHPANENFSKVQFENEQIRVTRSDIVPHKSLELSTAATEPTLIVALSLSKLASSKSKTRIELAPGKTAWIAAGQQQTFENTGDASAEILRFDFKTRPFDDPGDRTGKH